MENQPVYTPLFLVFDCDVFCEKSRDGVGSVWSFCENYPRLAMNWPTRVVYETLNQSLFKADKLHVALVGTN